ncbi:metal-dependent hydrolase family protein [Paremcibacter congregatus]|uniref:Amidohydrolase n=1 Tax=Paremcibacter congregatus TaxID=2043170 RepID=A0A2G4YQY0_9PROT|nr:amidohydrolase family protein [Paremcibacter congregatus]PHZ84725.1 amidohydrolase [Paremcibacter congregatus]QDE28920.1 amidohydrolase family protein [Paremcibacter congregatus]
MIVLENCLIFDGEREELQEGLSVFVEKERIKDISKANRHISDAHYINCEGRVLMPGLIDAHVHAYTPSFDVFKTDHMPPSLLASHAARTLEGMLRRGFTTVRDAAGGDRGLYLGIEQGLIDGPRFFYSGRAISQTGGHGDLRPDGHFEPCGCKGYSGSLSLVVDGEDEVRRAVREELRQGAHQIKIFASGGVCSPADPLWMDQMIEAEIRAAVYEASVHRTYVMAHCHTDGAAKRCVEYGVRTIEHGSEISADTAELIVRSDAYVVPTLSVMAVVRDNGHMLGLPPMSLEKIQGLYETTLGSIETCKRAGVKLGLGSDLLDSRFHPLQGGELALRGEVDTPIEVLRSATSINAEILNRQGELGCIAEGAYADMILLDFNPLKSLEPFGAPEKNILFVMKGGRIVRSSLPA